MPDFSFLGEKNRIFIRYPISRENYVINCMCRCGDCIESGVVLSTYRCCAATRGYLCHHTQEEEAYVGLEHSSSFEWRPQWSLEELHLLQPTYVSSCVGITTGGICWLL